MMPVSPLRNRLAAIALALGALFPATLAVAPMWAGACGGPSSGSGGSGGATGSGGAITGTGGSTGTGGGAAGASGQGGQGTGGASTGGAGGASTGGATGQGGSAGSAGAGGAGGTTVNCASPATYDETVLCDQPVAFWAMKATGATEPDLVGSNDGTYEGAAPTTTALPNGDLAAHFDGATGYLTIPSNAVLSIPTTQNLTWEGWINADLLQFPNNSNGYVDWMGKCASYSPTCEWEARMYTTTNSASRPNRMSAYVFNPAAGLGSGADWQPANNLIMPSSWYYIVGEYTTLSAPAVCQNTSMYPGSINIWVNGIEWDQAQHGQTGCMSQYSVIPVANGSPLNIGTMAQDTWFPGAVGKVAVYDKLLTQAQITGHYQAMTGQTPTGSCTNTCAF